MNNLVPSPDPNSCSASTSNQITAIVVPKVEPKLEPLDESESPHFGISQLPPQILPPSPKSPPDFNYQLTPSLNEERPNPDPSQQTHVYSEFHRVSQLFHTAFSQSNGDSEVPDPDSRAIVLVPTENRLSTVVVSAPPPPQKRSSELVRVTNLQPEDEGYFREVVRKTRMLYDSLRVFCMAEDRRRDFTARRSRGDLKAATVMKDRGLWLNRDKRILGTIPGVVIGDVFFFRIELCIVGLHGVVQAGIDYVPPSQSANGEPIATSIVVSGGYEDDEDGGNEIIYTGQGGQDKHFRQCFHQKLETGNLGLERSMHYGLEVRVIRGFKYEGSISGKVYVYDGLYKIVETWFDVGKSGFGVYKFRLLRIENQPDMGSAILRFAENLRSKPLAVRPTGYLSFDISSNEERIPVFLYNDIDACYDPMYYNYLATSIFSPHVYAGNTGGCSCVSGCMIDCSCALRNGGEFAYDHNGILVRGKPLIFECGRNCSCPPTCHNRVSQKGVRNRFEVFRSRETGWGVRSLDMIPAGSFLCEYAGVALTKEQAQIVTANGDSLVYPYRFPPRWAEWGDLSQIFTDYVSPSYPTIPQLDFAMDVSRMRNVACYMSHSSSPNVLVQFVLYDHYNLLFPHLMLFAMENIPPLRELSLDYGMAEE